MLNSSRTLAGALVLIFFVACSTVAPEPADVVKPDNSGVCGDAWLLIPSIPGERHNATAVRLDDGTVIVAGGYWFDPNDDTVPARFVAGAQRFNPSNDTWTAAGTLNTPRYGHGAVGLKDGNGRVTKVLVVGGQDDSGLPTRSAEIYDSATNRWTEVEPMSTDRWVPQVTVLSDGRRVLVSGGIGGGVGVLKTAEIYDSQADDWSSAGEMKTKRFAAGVALLPNGKVLVAGGNNGTLDYEKSAEIFDPSSRTWTYTASMSAARYAFGMAGLKNGKVLAAGGVSPPPPPAGDEPAAAAPAGSEIFDPASGTWSLPTTDMIQPFRSFFNTIPLADGRVMVAGGLKNGVVEGREILDGAEIYDPDRGTRGEWVQVNSMNTLRHLAAAVELLDNPATEEIDNRILIAGGYAQANTGAFLITDTAETYQPCPANLAPIAHCRDRVVHTNPDPYDPNALACVVPGGPETDVNDNSSDPDNFPQSQLTIWQSPSGPYHLGPNLVTLYVSDGSLTSSCTATVTVEDHTPPVAGGSKGMVLWPANSAYRDVTLMDCAQFAQDSCSGRLNPLRDYEATITHVTADEPDNATGGSDGDTTADVLFHSKHSWKIMARAERDTTSNGRVYTLHYRFKDPAGNTAFGSCRAGVPVALGDPASSPGPAPERCIDNPYVGGDGCL